MSSESFTSFTSIGGSYTGIYGDSGNNNITCFNITAVSAWDNVHAGGGDDYVLGKAGNDALFGEAGIDTLFGGDGDDTVDGGDGNDRLHGEAGNDSLSGGDGADEFVFGFAAGTGTDTIADFSDGTDLIRIETPTGLTYGDLTISSINGGTDTGIAYAGSTVILVGIASASIDATDFFFV